MFPVHAFDFSFLKFSLALVGFLLGILLNIGLMLF